MLSLKVLKDLNCCVLVLEHVLKKLFSILNFFENIKIWKIWINLKQQHWNYSKVTLTYIFWNFINTFYLLSSKKSRKSTRDLFVQRSTFIWLISLDCTSNEMNRMERNWLGSWKNYLLAVWYCFFVKVFQPELIWPKP